MERATGCGVLTLSGSAPRPRREDTPMTRNFRKSLCAAAICVPLVLGACATKQERVADKEDKLAAAGVVARPADTPARQAMLQKLPPDKFVMRPAGGNYVYLYSDPLVCGCLYVGSAQAYTTYKQEMFQQQLANEQQLTAQMYNDPSWNFGAWGGPWGPLMAPASMAAAS